MCEKPLAVSSVWTTPKNTNSNERNTKVLAIVLKKKRLPSFRSAISTVWGSTTSGAGKRGPLTLALVGGTSSWSKCKEGSRELRMIDNQIKTRYGSILLHFQIHAFVVELPD